MAKQNENPATESDPFLVALRSFSGDWHGQELTGASLTVPAFVYFLSMGVSQAQMDIDASRAEFVGVKNDGTKPKSVKPSSFRESLAKEFGLTGYDDSIMLARNTLADMYFEKRAADKLAKIMDGTLTHGGGRGPRMDDATRTRYEVIESILPADLVKAAKTKLADMPEYKDLGDTALTRVIFDKAYESKAEFKAEVDAEVARRLSAEKPKVDLSDLGINVQS